MLTTTCIGPPPSSQLLALRAITRSSRLCMCRCIQIFGRISAVYSFATTSDKLRHKIQRHLRVSQLLLFYSYSTAIKFCWINVIEHLQSVDEMREWSQDLSKVWKMIEMCYFGHINLMRVRKKRESERKSGGAEMLRVRTASCVILSKIYVANLSLYRLTTKRCQIHPFWRASSPPSGKRWNLWGNVWVKSAASQNGIICHCR